VATGLLLVAACAAASAAGTGQSQWVRIGADGKLAYKTTPAGDRIMDFSYAGYHGGGVALPDLPVARTVRPSGQADDSDVIQAGIDEVARLPLRNGFRGAVLLAPGTFRCSRTITIAASGVVLRGSGSAGAEVSTIQLTGAPHVGIAVRLARGAGVEGVNPPSGERLASQVGSGSRRAQTTIVDSYVPSGARSFQVASAAGLAAGDTVLVERPVTEAWIRFMQMDDLVRDGRRQTWIRPGTRIAAERTIAAVSGNTVTLEVPVSDSYDAKYVSPGATLVKIDPVPRVSECGVEHLRVECPPQAFNHTQPHFQALRIVGQDCWSRDVVMDETMNSVAVTGKRITLERLTVNRRAKHQGSSKPAEFAPVGTQVLLDRCAVNADNVWFSATGSGGAGPIVLLNCTFHGNGRAESHQRWSTGILYDNCRAPEGGIELRNRGSMGSGHGWTMGFGVVWNCTAGEYIVQDPPGTVNWLIGSTGTNRLAPRPFGSAPPLPAGIVDSPGEAVAPQSLYLAQLAERLGLGALKNVGYESPDRLEGR
jgi:hypothetical protein